MTKSIVYTLGGFTLLGMGLLTNSPAGFAGSIILFFMALAELLSSNDKIQKEIKKEK